MISMASPCHPGLTRQFMCSAEVLMPFAGLPKKIYNLFKEEIMKKYGLFIVMTISVMFLGVSYGFADAADTVASPVVVTIDGSAFSPEAAIIKVGGEVVWRNKDAAVHTVTANDGSFDSGALPQGGEFKKQFPSAGIFKYACDNHAWMSGTIEVR